MNGSPTLPGWSRADIEQDPHGCHRLSPAAVADFERALRTALASGRDEWTLTPEDFPLGPDGQATLDRVVEHTQHGRGFQLLRGFPAAAWPPAALRTLFWGLGLHLGVARPQGKASQFLSDVRDIGTDYRSHQGRGYSSKSALDFHADGSDLVGLLCIRTARSGGESLISSSERAFAELQRNRPDLAEVLQQPFHFSRQGEQAPEEPPHYQAAIVGFVDGRFHCRHIRNHIRTAQLSFPELPRLTPVQLEALDTFDALLAREDLCFRMDFEPGDLQFINNHRVLHARTDYEDFEAPEDKRHLLRLWLAMPQGQALPASWADAYKDVSARAVRGGFRGTGITPVQQAFEHRLARHHQMACTIYRDREAFEAHPSKPMEFNA